MFRKFLLKKPEGGPKLDDRVPTPENETLFQAFEWNVPADGQHWQRIQRVLPDLSSIGITNVWLPPGCKADNPEGNGYDIYDLYDLGEFEQKRARRTKWGTKEELLQLASEANEMGIGLYWDAVLNHRMGGDHTEKCQLVEVDGKDRTKDTCKPYETEAWLRFDYDGRGGKYSEMKYNSEHFVATDWDNNNQKNGIFRVHKDNQRVSKRELEQKMKDYLMFSELDYAHPDVADDVKNWGAWIVNEVGLRGFRLDAVQHFSDRFTSSWIDHVEKTIGPGKLFYVGEYWVDNVKPMLSWLKKTNYKASLYDSPLLNNFSRISLSRTPDLRTVFSGSLVATIPSKAVTVVTNHDTQPGQTVATPIESFFKPLAYSLILLRQEGYPCVFYGDLYGTKGQHAEPPSCQHKLADLILARKLYAYGEQVDYFSKPTCIGWVRRGRWDKPFGLAVVMSTAGPGQIKMEVGAMHKDEIWTDVLGSGQTDVEIDAAGNGSFGCLGKGVSVWVNRTADPRHRFPVNYNDDIYGV